MCSFNRLKRSPSAVASPLDDDSNEEEKEDVDEAESRRGRRTKVDPNVPQLLTVGAAKNLVTYLDAGDALECYLLTRQTYLHYSLGSSSSSSTNDTSTTAPTVNDEESSMIPVQTTALGLRYRPTAQDGKSKAPLSLTLEYGPNRAGRDNLHLSVPLITSTDPEYVQWTNEAQVYYTLNISSKDYVTANYIASLTGAVLTDLLETASWYPIHHRRYQPWQVAATEDTQSQQQQPTPQQPRLLLKSSGDYDFVQYLLQHLASVGVELSPVLQPTIHRLQFTATSLQRQTLNPQAQQEMTIFYHKLYQCVQSIADAVVPQPTTLLPSFTNAPSASPTITPAPTAITTPPDSTSTLPPTANNNMMHATATPSHQQQPPHDRYYHTRAKLNKRVLDNQNAYDDLRNHLQEQGTIVIKKNNSTEDGQISYDDNDDPTYEDFQTADDNKNENYVTTSEDYSQTTNDKNDTSHIPTASPTTASPTFPTTLEPTMDISSPPTGPTLAPISNAEAAVEAANEAQQAANVAAQDSNDPHQAAQAAKDAATAAQKAATATQLQQAQLRQEALFSVSGVAPTISLCLSDPSYGLASSNHTTTVYLYWDSTYYFTAQVVAPYIRVVSAPASLPHPTATSTHNAFGGSSGEEGEFIVDWMLATVLTAFFIFTCLIIIQQVLGRNSCLLIPRLYKFQRWFFDPTRARSYDNEWYFEEQLEEAAAAAAAAAATQLAEEEANDDSIPRSMGGRTKQTLKRRKRQQQQRIGMEDPLAALTMATAAAAATSNNGGNHLAAAAATNESSFVIDGDDDDDDDDDKEIGALDLGDVELSDLRPLAGSRIWGGSPMTAGSFHSNPEVQMVDLLATVIGERPSCFQKDPELVDLPDLRSSSKVAVPVSIMAAAATTTTPRNNSNHNNSHHNTGSSDTTG